VARVTRPPAQTDTTTDSLVPPGAEAYEHAWHVVANEHVAEQAVLQVTKLADFLVENFPDEINPSNRQVPETPVDTAVRLLLAFSATNRATQVKWCPETYCNRTRGHGGPCGWVESSG
jgi:hypothetical protein